MLGIDLGWRGCGRPASRPGPGLGGKAGLLGVDPRGRQEHNSQLQGGLSEGSQTELPGAPGGGFPGWHQESALFGALGWWHPAGVIAFPCTHPHIQASFSDTSTPLTSGETLLLPAGHLVRGCTCYSGPAGQHVHWMLDGEGLDSARALHRNLELLGRRPPVLGLRNQRAEPRQPAWEPKPDRTKQG